MDQVAAIENGVLPVEILNDRQAQVFTELSMMDGKMIDLIQGDSGAFCHYCYATRADANDILKIQNGFKIEKKSFTATNAELDKCTNHSTLVMIASTVSPIRNFVVWTIWRNSYTIWFRVRLTRGQKLSFE